MKTRAREEIGRSCENEKNERLKKVFAENWDVNRKRLKWIVILAVVY